MMSSQALVLVVLAASIMAASAFAPTLSVPSLTPQSVKFHALGAIRHGGRSFEPHYAARQSAAVSLRMSADEIQKVSSDAVKEALANCQYWSCTPSQLTMYTDNPETFQLLKGKVAVMPVTVSGVPTGDPVEFDEGDCGIIPAGSFRWEIQKPSTKMTNCREGLQMTTKGWQEESPFKALQGKGTLSTKGRTSEDDLKYLKELVASKGAPPQSSWENAIAYKLDRDIYCANLAFVVTDKGILVQDRVSEVTLEVLTEAGFEPYNEQETYVETEGSVRWRKDGNFAKNAFIREENL